MTDRPPRRAYAPDFLSELFRNPLDPGYTDAAERRRRLGPPTARQRATTRTVSAVTLALVGFLLAVAYRQTVADEPGRSHAREGLVAQIKQREVVADQLTDRANDLRAEVARQRDAELTGSDAARLRELEAATGLRRVRGDGGLVRVADGAAKKDTMTGAQGPNLALVRDSDLQGIANGLWAAGAEAISINGQRLTATSTIRLAGEAILVDYRPVTGPYEVSAIGPGQLERRFKDSQVARLFRSLTAEYGMSFDVRSVDNLDLPAANEPQLRYAQLPAQPSPTPSGVGATPHPTTSGGGR
ncbi:DUF881 domain-containing protein [Micromonospora zhanjiangensis]